MAGTVAGRVIDEYFPKMVFSRHFPSLSEAEQGVRSASVARGRVSAEGRAISAPEGEPRQGRSGPELIADIRRTADTLLASVKVAVEIGTADDTCLVHAFFGEMTAAECVPLAAWHIGWHLRTLDQERSKSQNSTV